LENVRGHLTLGFKEVLQGLADQGYDAKWRVIRAADVGAPHARARLFIVAYPNGNPGRVSLSNEEIANSNDNGCNRSIKSGHETQQPSSKIIISNPNHQHKPHDGQVSKLGRRFTSRREMHLQGIPNVLDKDGKLSATFVEYMMGLQPGWVTDTGLSRAQQLKMLGNGVVPQQAEYALELLCS
jgi:DNA (cytosine-5)-methyltransferase 1